MNGKECSIGIYQISGLCKILLSPQKHYTKEVLSQIEHRVMNLCCFNSIRGVKWNLMTGLVCYNTQWFGRKCF